MATGKDQTTADTTVADPPRRVGIVVTVPRCTRCGSKLAYEGRPCTNCLSPATFTVRNRVVRDLEGPRRTRDPKLPRFALPAAIRNKKARLPRRERAIQHLRTLGAWTWNSLAIAAAIHIVVLAMALLLRSDVVREMVYVHQVVPESQIAEIMGPSEDDAELPFLPADDDEAVITDDPVDDLDLNAGDPDYEGPPDDIAHAPEPIIDIPEPAPPQRFPVRPGESPFGLGGGDHNPNPDPVAGSGLYRNRQGDSRQAAVRRYGGGDDTEEAVNLGLEYLARMQRSNGMWHGHDGFAVRPSWLTTDTRSGGITALCVLPFLAAGHSPRSGQYRSNVSMAIQWIMSQQATNGYIGFSGPYDMYMHTVATLALCEAYGLSGDEEIRRSAERAVRYLERSQSNGGGWCYSGQARTGSNHTAGRSDASITGWAVLALKSAMAVGIPVREFTWRQMIRLYDSLSLPGGETYYADENYGRLNASRKGIGMVGVGLMARTVLDDEVFNERNQAAEGLLLGHLPKYEDFFLPSPDLNTPNFNTFYGWYNGTLGIFLKNDGSGAAWQTWNRALKEALLPNQVLEGSRRGSWSNDDSWIGRVMGDFYSTASALLCLTIYYRYNPIHRDGVLFSQAGGDAPTTDPDVVRRRVPAEPPPPAEPTPGERSTALREDARSRGLGAVPDLVLALRDDAPAVRGTALTELGRLRAKDAAQSIVEMLDRPENQSLRLSIFDALGRIGERSVAPTIIRHLNSHEEYIVNGAQSALRRLSGGRDFGTNARAWTDWFNRNP